MAETAVREAREEISRAMARSPAWFGSRFAVGGQSDQLEPSLAQGSGILRRRKDGTSPRASWCCRAACARATASLCLAFAARGRLEARALDCSGGSAGFVVLCRIPTTLDSRTALFMRSSPRVQGRRWESRTGRPATTRRRPGRREAPSAHSGTEREVESATAAPRPRRAASAAVSD